jgi:hypothetical protein
MGEKLVILTLNAAYFVLTHDKNFFYNIGFKKLFFAEN